jgi:hypothetical protein
MAMTTTIDHLVFACPDVEGTSRWFSKALGVDPAIGGRHPGVGTRNTLLSLGARTYLELMGPDSDQPAPSEARPFGIDRLGSPSLRGWAAAPDDMSEAVVEARRHGHPLCSPVEGRRLTQTGDDISWRMARPEQTTKELSETPQRPSAPEVFPFLIDWGTSAHPATTSPGGLMLEGYVLLTPAPGPARDLLEALGLEGPWEVEASPTPALRAVIANQTGDRITLVS